ncbi:hypothetical protein AADH33_03480 [Psychrobacter sp. KFRI-CH2-11]|uniref:hypothetical protein n=1 Tax=Psychrobacter sp. KFRI-CH2-11 TaxID=3156079 RepID=UPI00324AB197
MSKHNYKLREPLNRHLIINTIKDLKGIDGFNHRKAALQAIIDVVIAIQDSYHGTDGQNVLIEAIIQILVLRPVVRYEMKISKSDLAKKPLIMQLLILMQDIVVTRQRSAQQKLLWLAIAMHTAVLLMHYNKKTHTNNMLMQFKLAQFSESNKRTWIWDELPDTPTMSANGILASLENILVNLESQAEIEIDKLVLIKPLISQISKIINAYREAHYLKRRIKVKPAKHIKPINLTVMSNLQPKQKAKIVHSLSDTNHDIDHKMPALQSQNYTPQTEEHEGLVTSHEEILDHYEPSFIHYESMNENLAKSVLSVPLQTIDLSLQQNHIAQNDLALNSNVRALPKNSYQAVFATLHQDAKSIDASYRSCASILLLSMITALPVESLLITGYIGHPSIFKIGTQRSYIQHRLGITKRDGRFDESKHENQFDVIKIPLPQWLVDDLLEQDLPSINDINAYIKQLRAQIGLPYLSVSRIETALPIVLSRYTADSNAHIADLICRTPAPLAPAMYYSGHRSEEIFAHYKSSLEVLNNGCNFDSSYITPWHKYSTGSVFALTPEYAYSVIRDIYDLTNTSLDADTHFNRVSIFTWFVFCLLTGVRPNNGIGYMSDIDLISGWLLIDDKPIRQVQSQRLVPLCPTLQRYLNDYKNYLINYQLSHLLKHDISADIDAIRLGDEVALLRLLSDSFDALTIIKRGDAYQMTKSIIDENPYWTRHFVRSQLEKLGVELVLINAVIGHEKARQEVLGRFSSSSKSQIKSVSYAFERIAVMLGLDKISINRGASCCQSL